MTMRELYEMVKKLLSKPQVDYKWVTVTTTEWPPPVTFRNHRPAHEVAKEAIDKAISEALKETK